MKKLIIPLSLLICLSSILTSQTRADFQEEKELANPKEFKFIGYYLMRYELVNYAPTNDFFKGQVVGRLFGGNTTRTMDDNFARFGEQRFLAMLTYSPRLFDGWAKIRMSFELDWTLGTGNYSAGGNFGGAFGADAVNMQTQNLFIEFNPNKKLYINAGLLRLYDNIRVPFYTGTDDLINTGYRLALFGSDASGISGHYFFKSNQRIKAGAYQLYENNVDHDDDVILYELDYEYDVDIFNSIGFNLWYLNDDGSSQNGGGEGGVSILGQGLNSGLTNYNGVANFDFGSETYNADIYWLGTHFHGNPLLHQGRFGYNGFILKNFGKAVSESHDVTIDGYAANLRTAYKYGKNLHDFVSLDLMFTTGDTANIRDGKYTGVLTGNNWTSPGAVWFSHGCYLLLPHGDVVNRFNAAVVDIQNMGLGLAAVVLKGSYDITPYKLRATSVIATAISPITPYGGGNIIGTEVNAGLVYSPRVFMDLELHAAYLKLGDFFDSEQVNGGLKNRPVDPWKIIFSIKWIMF